MSATPCAGLSQGLTGGTATLWPRLALVLSLIALPVEAEPPIYRVDPSLTTVEFAATQLGLFLARGTFRRMSGRIIYDPLSPAGSVDFDLAAASVTTGWGTRDAFIRGEDMFDAERHPVIQFRSTRLTFEHDKPARIDGELTLRGVTRPLSLTVARFNCGTAGNGRETCSAEVSGTVHRSDFGMDILVPLIGDDVELRFVVTAIRQ